MTHKKGIIIISFISMIVYGCGHCNWTAGERARFEQECSLQDSFNYLACEFRGFENNAFDSILIEEYHNATLADAFKIKVDTFKSPWDKEHKVRSFKIARKMSTKFVYKFIVDSCTVYTLKKMKMEVWPRGPFCPDCTMGNYMIDSVIFEHNANPCFIKKGYTF